MTNHKSLLKTFFLKIAAKLGLELHEKTENKVSFMEHGFNPTAVGAGVVANIAIDDSDIVIKGESNRAKALTKIKDYFQNEIETAAATVALATGDCLIRPFTDGEFIGFNIIGNDDFEITESVGLHLKGIIIKLDEYATESNTYRLFESQTLKSTEHGKVVVVKRFAFKNTDEIGLENTQWKAIKTDDIFLTDQLLIGRYKCPTINRDNYNSVSGVPITFGCEDIVENVRKKYNQYNEEFNRKETVVFADRSLFRKENKEDGKTRLVRDGKEYVTFKGDLNNGISDMIREYSPGIRETEFKAGIDLNLSVLELCCGFSRGVFTTPETSFATATEMINSLKKTFSFVKRFRASIENGNAMLFKTIDFIISLIGKTPVGDWSLEHDWSYDYIEQTTEKFNQLLQAHAAGCLKDEDLVGWIKGINEQEAKEYMEELRQLRTDELTNVQTAE